MIPRALYQELDCQQSTGDTQATALSLGSRQVGAAESQIARTSQGGLSLRPQLRQTSPEDIRQRGYADKAGRQIMGKRGPAYWPKAQMSGTGRKEKSPDAAPGGRLGLWS